MNTQGGNLDAMPLGGGTTNGHPQLSAQQILFLRQQQFAQQQQFVQQQRQSGQQGPTSPFPQAAGLNFAQISRIPAQQLHHHHHQLQQQQQAQHQQAQQQARHAQTLQQQARQAQSLQQQQQQQQQRQQQLQQRQQRQQQREAFVERKAGPEAPRLEPRARATAEEMSLLERLVYPMPAGEFMRDVWTRKALVVRGAAARLDSLKANYLFDLDVREMLENTASEKIFAWLPGRPAAAPGETGQAEDRDGPIGSVELGSADDGMTAFESGASLYFRSSQRAADRWIPALTESMGLGFAGRYNDGDVRGEIETFISHPGNLTPAHFDYMDTNFTIQLAGCKTWRLHRSTVQNPLRGCTPHYKLSDDTLEQQAKVNQLEDPEYSSAQARPGPEVVVEEVTLAPGDILYFPGGLFHRVEVAGTEVSKSINFSLMTTNWADFIADSLRQLMWTDARFRAPISLSDAAYVTPDSGTDARQVDAQASRGPLARKHLASLLGQVGDWLMADESSTGLHPADMLSKAIVQRQEPEESDNDGDDEDAAAAGGDQSDSADGDDEDDDVDGQDEPIRATDGDDAAGAQGVSSDRPNGGTLSPPSATLGAARYRVNCLAALVGPEPAEEEGKNRYTMHSHFGNEDISSAVQCELVLPERVTPVLSWLVRAKKSESPAFTLASICRETAPFTRELGAEKISELLEMLSEAGFLTKL